MPTDNKRMMPAEIRRICNLGRTLGALPESAKAALWDVLEDYFKESHDKATSDLTSEEKRAFWCGANHLATELRRELQDLMNEGWRSWPGVQQWREAGGEEE